MPVLAIRLGNQDAVEREGIPFKGKSGQLTKYSTSLALADRVRSEWKRVRSIAPTAVIMFNDPLSPQKPLVSLAEMTGCSCAGHGKTSEELQWWMARWMDDDGMETREARTREFVESKNANSELAPPFRLPDVP